MPARMVAVVVAGAVLAAMPVASPGADATSSRAAAADSGWGAAITLSAPQDGWRVASGAPPSTAVAPGGAMFVVWASGRRVMAAVKRPGESWSPPRALYRSRSVRAAPVNPVIGTDSAGTLTVAWEQGQTVRAARRPVGGPWGPAVRIAQLTGHQRVVSHLHLAVGVDGTALVTFWRGRAKLYGAEDYSVNHAWAVAVVRPAGGRWGRPFSYAGPLDHVWGYCNPDLAPGYLCLVHPPAGVVYSGGTVTVGWSNPGYFVARSPAYVRTRLPGGTWQSRVRLTPRGQHAMTPFLAATSWGQVTAAWNDDGSTATRTGSRSRVKPPGGTWGPVEQVARRADVEGLGVDDTGAATALVMNYGGRVGWTAVVTRPRWGAWGDRTVIGPRGWSAGVRLAVNPTGEAVAAYSAHGSTVAGWRNSSAPWPSVVRLGDESKGLSTAAIGPDDTAVVVWYRYRGERQRMVVLKGNVHPG